jgi:hypothetical protein
MTISGAAASPNMGQMSSPLVTFLMTLFNARLGAWLGNPGPAGRKTFDKAAPTQSIQPIFAEMFGMTSDQNRYVNLSDGGHFENLALYEMVLRRNRLIVVSDGGADPKCTFQDLGNAVRKIRVDFGIRIEFNSPMAIYARNQAPADGPTAYWAIGRVRYADADMRGPGNRDDYDGIVIYIKPAVYKNEPRDVYNYAQTSPTFPHESTTDQFFSESQFESYRALGDYIVEQLVAQAGSLAADQRDADLLARLWPELGAASDERKRVKAEKEGYSPVPAGSASYPTPGGVHVEPVR